ncbi:Gfo/Idh/MocA family protein [Demequina iriomotensis]|uniref:Gfo/Idh/MocA family protein n=1 Tax=Demequina iriomotensis TaxID=1536641 RepID=UPI000AE9A597|nr:Gfo/Idh/MocA family oxidoreductase [Demequina iriomotensis]
MNDAVRVGGTAAPLRIGVLGAARIVKDALVAPAADLPGVEVAALAARDRARAEAAARRHRIPEVHGSYEAMLEDPAIDAVYVPLPAALHAQWTIAAARAGKHVLCEKPFTSHSDAAVRVAEETAATGVVVMEAYHTHHHPLMGRLREILAGGELGTVRRARATFCAPIPPGRDIRWNLALGGGGLLDIGYYPVRMLRELFGGAPEVVDARAVMRGDIDRLLTADLAFEGGVEGSIVSSMWSRRLVGATLTVEGDAGTLEVPLPYHPQMRGIIKVRTAEGRRVERVDRRSTYAYQLQAFARAARGSGPIGTDVEAAIAQMRVLDAIYDAAGVARRP